MKDRVSTDNVHGATQTENNTKKSIIFRILQATWNWIKANKWGLLAAFMATALVAGLVFGGIVYYPMVLFMLEAVPYIGIGVAKLAFAATTIPQAATIVGAIAGGLTAAAITSIWLFVGTCKMVFNKLIGAGSPPGGSGAGSSAAVHEDHEASNLRLSVSKNSPMTALHSHMEGWKETVPSITTNPSTMHPQPHQHSLHARHIPLEVLLGARDSANDGLYSMSPGSVDSEHAEATAQKHSSVGSHPYSTFTPARAHVLQLDENKMDHSSDPSDYTF